MYGLVRLFYERFYDNFYVAPEDVGASSSVVLAQTAVGLISLFGFSAILAALAFGLLLFYGWLLYLFARLFRRRNRPVVPDWLKARRALKVVAIATLSLTLVSLVLDLRRSTDWAVDCALAGESVETVDFRPLSVAILRLRAQRIEVTWLNPSRKLESARGERVLYLGEASGVVSVYDVDSRRTVRFPSSAVAITFLRSPECPASLAFFP